MIWCVIIFFALSILFFSVGNYIGKKRGDECEAVFWNILAMTFFACALMAAIGLMIISL